MKAMMVMMMMMKNMIMLLLLMMMMRLLEMENDHVAISTIVFRLYDEEDKTN